MRLQHAWDFAIRAADGRIAAFVEVKRRAPTSARWAAELRAGMIDRDARVGESPLLLVSADRVYFWRAGLPSFAPPSAMLDAAPLLGPYLTRARVDGDTVDPLVFEDVVEWWLSDLVRDGVGVGGFGVDVSGGEVVREGPA